MIKIYNEVEILNKIEQLINPLFLESSNLELSDNSSSKNSSTYKSINIIKYDSNNASVDKKYLLARIKTTGKVNYISFNSKYEYLFNHYNINYETSKDGFIRVSLSILDDYASESLSNIFDTIFLDSFNYPSFGCCSRYVECSDNKRCVHTDILYASSACMYKKNLDNGKIFYGINKNI